MEIAGVRGFELEVDRQVVDDFRTSQEVQCRPPEPPGVGEAAGTRRSRELRPGTPRCRLPDLDSQIERILFRRPPGREGVVGQAVDREKFAPAVADLVQFLW